MCTHTHLTSLINENSIKITNHTDQPLNNIKLIFNNANLGVTEYKVIRERGSLSFLVPPHLIELGNLFPDETAELYFKFESNHSSFSSSFPPDVIQISYSLENEENIISDLTAFMEHKNRG